MKKQFICASTECCSFNRFVAAPYLRKSFETDNDLKNAELTICGLGFYEVYINGINITKGPLAPYISNPNHLCYYDKYDVSKYLIKGKNTMGIILGNGFYNPFAGSIWNFNKADWINPPCVAFELSINNEVVFEADDTVRVNNSPIIFDELRMGEYYDANREIKNWNMPCFDDSLWSCALKAPTPKGILTECKAEPITVRYKLKPIEIYDTEDGYVYDFGENNSGVCTLRIKAKKGQVIELSHAEMMTNGKFDNYSTIFDREDALFYPEYSQKDKYIASGEGVEEYTPKFTYHGFRYVLVKGITKEQATNELLTYNMRNDKEHLNDRSKWSTYQLLKPYFKRECFLLTAETDIEKLWSFANKHKKIFAKPINACSGNGARIIEIKSQSDCSSIKQDLLVLSKQWILEELINQDERIASLNSSSVNTIRIPSFRTKNGVCLLEPSIRMGRQGSCVDNAGAGGIITSVDGKTGCINYHAIDYRGNKYYEHPDSHIKLDGWQVPQWDDLLKLVKEVHLALPQANKYIGFDFALSKKGWVVVEINWGDLTNQTIWQRGLKKDFIRLLNS